MVMGGCGSTDWSAVSSATANTALAGVLAGFMINGIVMLLSTRPDPGQRSGYVQGAGLLFTALVTLGLDAYMFALVTGETAAQACRRAWTEAMYAAGLLGLGAVSVIVSVVFLLGVFFWQSSNDEESMDKSKDMLATLCVWLRPGVALVVILFLWVTARSYLASIFNDHPPGWASGVLTGVLVVDLVVVALFVTVYAWIDPAETRFVPRSGLLGGLIRLVWQGLQPDAAGETKTLRFAIFTASGYSLLSAGFTGFVIGGPASFWVSSTAWAKVVYTATVIWVLLVGLIPLGALLAPTFGPGRAAGRPDDYPATDDSPPTRIEQPPAPPAASADAMMVAGLPSWSPISTLMRSTPRPYR